MKTKTQNIRDMALILKNMQESKTSSVVSDDDIDVKAMTKNSKKKKTTDKNKDVEVSDDSGAVNELSNKTLGSYYKKAAKDREDKKQKLQKHMSSNEISKTSVKKSVDNNRKLNNRTKGMSKAFGKIDMNKEESSYKDRSKNQKPRSTQTESKELSELSKNTLLNYRDKAQTQRKKATRIAHKLGQRHKSEPERHTYDSEDKKQGYEHLAKKRSNGIKIANKKIAKEEVEDLDELSKKTLGRYIKKASRDASHAAAVDANHAQKYLNSRDKIDKNTADNAFKRKLKRDKGISKAVNKLTNEENLDELSRKTLAKYTDRSAADGNDKKNKRTFTNRLKGIKRDTDRLAKKKIGENVEIRPTILRLREHMATIAEKNRDHTKGATPSQPHDDTLAKGAKEFVAQHGGFTGNPNDVVDVNVAMDKNKAASDGTMPKPAKGRPNDSKVGDKKILKSSTNESTDLSELSKKVLVNYARKSGKYVNNPETKKKSSSKKVQRKVSNRIVGIGRTLDRLTKDKNED